jgi:glycosyltransferase involved in cell wall biosynthesis
MRRMNRLAEHPIPTGSTRRILAVVRWPVGGIRTHILYDYPYLLEAGYRFTFVGPDDDSFSDFAGAVASWPDVEFVRAPVHNRRCRLRSTVRPLLRSGRFALVHSHGMTAGVQVALASLSYRTPHVMTMHDVFRPVHRSSWLDRSRLWVASRLLARADAVIAVSEDVRENLLEYLPRLSFAACRLELIPYGIDTERFLHSSGQPRVRLKEQLGLRGDDFLLGFLGRFMEQKGFLPLLDALELLVSQAVRGLHLLAVGSGDCRRRYEEEATRRGLASVVTFRDFTPDVAPLLPELDLLVMPSLWEAAGILAMEALCAGVPVVGTSCIGLREVLRDSPSLVVPPNDPRSLAQALRTAKESTWRDAARAYAPRACERFSSRRSGQQLGEVFNQMLAARGRPHRDKEIIVR